MKISNMNEIIRLTYNSGAIKAMFCRAKEMYREEKVEKKDRELVREIDRFMQNF